MEYILLIKKSEPHTFIQTFQNIGRDTFTNHACPEEAYSVWKPKFKTAAIFFNFDTKDLKFLLADPNRIYI